MDSAVVIRPAIDADSRACFAVFHASLWELMRRIGHRSADTPDPDLEEQWPAYVGLFEHLAATCAQWWIAEDGDGRPVGYARSTQRGPVVELDWLLVQRGFRLGRFYTLFLADGPWARLDRYLPFNPCFML